MTALELCEPLFQYICRLNRSVRTGSPADPVQVRTDVRAILNNMQTSSLPVPGLRDQYDKLRLALVFFIDYMVRNTGTELAQSWHALAEEEDPPIYTGDEMFFDLLEDTLKDRTDASTDRLAVFYTCMGLGFRGFYDREPDTVFRKMKEIAGRIRHLMDSEEALRVCPEAYDALNTSDLTQPPMRPLVPMFVALVGLVIVLFAANAYLYSARSAELNADVHSVIAKASAITSAATGK